MSADILDKEIPLDDSLRKVPFTNFNYWISWIFLKNPRLTLLCLILLIVLGIFSGINLKTTGFPNPDVPFVFVQAVYPGANSSTVLNEVTLPLEGAIKNVSGVKKYNSTSTDSVSIIRIAIDEKYDANSVRSRVDSVIKSVNLPSEVESVNLIIPEVSGPSLILAVTSPNLEVLSENYEKTLKVLNQTPEVSSVQEINKIEKKVVITYDQEKLQKLGISQVEVENQLKTFRETIPVSNQAVIDNTQVSIITSASKNQLSDLRQYKIYYSPTAASVNKPQKEILATNLNSVTVENNQGTSIPRSQISPAYKSVELQEIADIQIQSLFKSRYPGLYGFYDKNSRSPKTAESSFLLIRTVANTDLGELTKSLKKSIENSGVPFLTRQEYQEIQPQSDQVYVIAGFNQNDENQQQVDQIISGIFGSSFSDSWWGKAGFLLGAIQLVVLVMIAFVSWRAAIVAALSIPLSITFSTIYIWIIGEQLNTLVLFSLVLVLGLVVDPALVILEAIQRKVDAKDKGNHAVLAAVKDVGNGIFLAALTNIIVFVPFGIFGGIFGKIFAYIPLTVIPAIIGSYIVPLVFLSWLGGLILKPSKNAVADEEKNLWPISKWLIRINNKILHSFWLVRLGIIILGVLIPFGVVFFLSSNNYIKQVQFAETEDTNLILANGVFLPQITQEKKFEVTQESLKILSDNVNVTGVIPVSDDDFNYYVFLNKTEERDVTAKEIAQKMNLSLREKFYSNKDQNQNVFFDLSVVQASVSGESSDYQSNIMIKSDNPENLKNASIKISEKIQNNLCFISNKVTFSENCPNNQKIIYKVDNGYTGKENTVYNLLLNRDTLIDLNLIQPDSSVTATINFLLRSRLQTEIKPITTVTNDNTELEVINSESLTANRSRSLNEIVESLSGSLKILPEDLPKLITVDQSQARKNIQRFNGQTINTISIALKDEYKNNQGIANSVTSNIIEYYTQDQGKFSKELGLDPEAVAVYDDGQSSEAQKFFIELGLALIMAVIVSYIVLAVFFNSLSQPLTILYTIPLALVGVLPALAVFSGGQIGFLEIIGLIILIGIVENVAIFLIDLANQKIDEGWDEKRAISYAAGIRFKPVLLTSLTAVASLAPSAIFSPFYRSIAVTIMFGILSSGIISLVTTPILYIFFRWLSRNFRQTKTVNKFYFLISPILGIFLPIWFFFFFGIQVFFLSVLVIIVSFMLLMIPFALMIIWGVKKNPVKNVIN